MDKIIRRLRLPQPYSFRQKLTIIKNFMLLSYIWNHDKKLFDFVRDHPDEKYYEEEIYNKYKTDNEETQINFNAFSQYAQIIQHIIKDDYPIASLLDYDDDEIDYCNKIKLTDFVFDHIAETNYKELYNIYKFSYIQQFNKIGYDYEPYLYGVSLFPETFKHYFIKIRRLITITHPLNYKYDKFDED